MNLRELCREVERTEARRELVRRIPGRDPGDGGGGMSRCESRSPSGLQCRLDEGHTPEREHEARALLKWEYGVFPDETTEVAE